MTVCFLFLFLTHVRTQGYATAQGIDVAFDGRTGPKRNDRHTILSANGENALNVFGRLGIDDEIG